MSERGTEPDIEPHRANVTEVPIADIVVSSQPRLSGHHRATTRPLHLVQRGVGGPKK